MQNTRVLWLTGLSGAGKTTLARALRERFTSAFIIDGDEIRNGLNSDLGFSPECRAENIRRIAELCKIVAAFGAVPIVSVISPYEENRKRAKQIIGPGFFEIYVSTPLEVCIARDVKGLYKQAKANELSSMTGISAPYEPPENPDVTINTANLSIEDCVREILEKLTNADRRANTRTNNR